MNNRNRIDFYEIDLDYIKQLSTTDSQVFYNQNDFNYKDSYDI